MKKLYIIILIAFIFSTNSVKALSASFSKCIDGDTANFKIGEEIKKARFLAIDTPEIKHGNKEADPYGNEAKNFTCNLLKNAKKITLEYDKNSDKTDKYGRVLVWVFVDDILLQEKLVENGLAKVAYLYGDYKYTDVLKKKESFAKKNNIKIWSEYKDDYSEYMYILLIALVVIIICFFDKSYRKKIVKKIKNKAKKSSDKEVDKLLK